MTRPDADLIRREYLNTARLLRHAAKRAMLLTEGDHSDLCKELKADMASFIPEYRELWLARAREGGLADSSARFEAAMKDY